MNWGILGAATIARTSMIPSIVSIPGNRIIAVASRDINTVKDIEILYGCSIYNGYEALINDDNIEAVYIPLPNSLHFYWAMRCLNAGKHVLVEKSAFCTYEEACKVIEAARENSKLIMENFQFIHHSQHRFIKSLIQDGTIGSLRAFKSSFGFPPFNLGANIRYDKNLGGGALLDAGAYVIRAASFILEDELEVVGASLYMNKEFNVDWYGNLLLKCKNRPISAHLSYGFDNFYQCNFEIWGSKGIISTNRAFTAKKGFNPQVNLELHSGKSEIILDDDDHFKNSLLHFNELIRKELYEEEYMNILRQSSLLEKVKELSFL